VPAAIWPVAIDRVERCLQDRAGDCGVPLGPKLVRLLLYADYLTLLASTPQQLQTLLDCLRGFCGDYCLEVNVPKCAVVVFGQRAVSLTGPADLLAPDGWLFAGQPVPLVIEFQ